MINPLNNFPIYFVYLFSRWRSIFVWSTCLFLLALMFTGLYESFSSEIDRMSENAPAPLEAVWGGDLEYASTPEGWLGIELYGLMLPVILSIVGVIAGASVIGNEENDGTLELLLASPISRFTLLVQKYLAAASQMLIIAFSVWIGIFIGTLLFPFDVSLLNVFYATLMAWLLGLVTFSITLSVQCAKGQKTVAVFAGTIFVSASYIADILPRLIDGLSSLKWVSAFFYYGGSDVLLRGIDPINLLLIVLVCALMFTFSIWTFNRRDTGTS